MRQISNQQQQILEALATYRFLTTSHIMRMGIIKHRNHAGTAFRSLQQGTKPLVDKATFAVHNKLGKLPNVHYLTKHGVKLLVEELGYDKEEIKFPKGTSSLFSQDYAHRIATIDSHINFRLSAISSGFDVDFFDTYFDKTGANRGKNSKPLEAKTKIEIKNGRYFIPDGAGRFDDGTNKHLFVFELYNGKDTKRVVEQLEKHQEALEMGTPTKRYSHDKGHRILCVFEHESELRAVAERMQGNSAFLDTRKFYLFKTLDQVRNNESFFINWLDYKLERHDIAKSENTPTVRVKRWKQKPQEQPQAVVEPQEQPQAVVEPQEQPQAVVEPQEQPQKRSFFDFLTKPPPKKNKNEKKKS